MKTIILMKDPYDENFYIFKKTRVRLQPGVTVLVGCNGYGKTTFLKSIKDSLRDDKIKYINFDNLIDGGSNAVSHALFYGDFSFGATAFCSSEGEQIKMNIGVLASKIRMYIDNNPEQNEYFILLDAVDSGFSIDNIQEVKRDLFNVIIEDCTNRNKDVYIVVSANEYEMCYGEKCFDVYNGTYRQFRTYESYRKFILKSREIKDKRYNN